MMLQRGRKKVAHYFFSSLPDLLPKKCLLVLNDTRVIPARVKVERASGAKGEFLIESEIEAGLLKAMGKPSKRFKVGDKLKACKDPSVTIEIVEKREGGWWHIKICPENLWPGRMSNIGEVPLPPYIKRDQGPSREDVEQYQTVFAKHEGSVAAPTASLHFTEQLLKDLKASGIEIVYLTHHVGAGTFLPVKTDDLSDHVMHAENYDISEHSSQKIKQAKKEGRNVIAVGTTVTRALESAAAQILQGHAAAAKTQLFIRPPYSFKVIDGLLTNFHLPESTLLMLVSAFHGKESVLQAYQEAIEEKYRFFSYGDAMLIVPT